MEEEKKEEEQPEKELTDAEVEAYLDEILEEEDPAKERKTKIAWIAFFGGLIALMVACIIIIVHFAG